MNARRIVVTGVGAVSPLGLDVASLWSSLLKGESGISTLTSVDTEHFSCKIGGEVNDFNAENYMDKRAARRLDPYAQYAMVAAQEAVKDSGLDTKAIEPVRAGVILGSGIGGLRTYDEESQKLEKKGARRVSPFLVPKMMINSASGNIAIEYGFAGPNFTTASACASANHAIGMAFQTILLDQADIMISGGSEQALAPLSFAGFCNARALSTSHNDEPAKASRPFDLNRDGFVFSQGAGLLVLEELEHAKKRGAKIYAEVVGFGMSDDAHHITAPHESGEGAANAMRMALKTAKLNPEVVDYVNAHGTSTKLGDIAETKAIRTVFGEHADKLWVSSTKSMVGHLLGASGGIEGVVCAKTVYEGKVHATINLETPDPDCDLDYVPNESREKKISYAVSNSFGFGGHNTSLVFARYDG